MSLVSVVVPVYQVESYIADCARSLFSQTWEDTEFIFVQDGCTDRSRERLCAVLKEEFPSLRDRVRILDKVNEGLPAARRDGVAAARGEWILHVDSDDWLEADAIRLLLEKARESAADLVYFDVKKEYGRYTQVFRERDYGPDGMQRYLQDIYRFRAGGYTVNKFARRELYADFFWPRFGMSEDMVVSAQLLQRCRRMAHLPQALYHYRRGTGTSISQSDSRLRDAQTARNFLDFIAFSEGKEPSPVAGIRDGMLLRAAWTAYRAAPELFTEYPSLKDKAAAIPLQRHCSLKWFRQVLLKRAMR